MDKTEVKRKYLTTREVEALMDAAKGSRNETRDRCLVLLMFRHGLRVSEACGLRLEHVNFRDRMIQVSRLKGSMSTTQPMQTDELRAIGQYLKIRGKADESWFFLSEQRRRMDRRTVNLLLAKYSSIAQLGFVAHPHMLRHACGFALADQGADTRLIQDYLGHRNIQHTVRYTASNPARFEKLWKDAR